MERLEKEIKSLARQPPISSQKSWHRKDESNARRQAFQIGNILVQLGKLKEKSNKWADLQQSPDKNVTTATSNKVDLLALKQFQARNEESPMTSN